jgi:DNA polymerase III sliding clamp (beta) subunit (PCNA family)
MKSITFETATLQDVVGKASKIAPTKGSAFDKAAGILLTAEGAKSGAIVKSTNVDVTYREEVNTLEVGDEDIKWRLNSETLATIVGGLPIGSGKTVTFSEDQKSGWVHIKSDRRKAKMAPMNASLYPNIPPYKTDGMTIATRFAERVKQVAWASHKNVPPVSGIHFDGKRAIATDKYCIAIADCSMPISKPITVPLSVLTPLLDRGMEVSVQAEERRLLVSPDDYTQITTTVYMDEYIPADAIAKYTPDDYDHKVEFDRAVFLETIQQITRLVKSERFPDLQLTFTEGELKLFLEAGSDGNDKTSEMEDVLDCNYDSPDSFTFNIDPSFFTKSLSSGSKPTFMLKFGPNPYRVIQVDCFDGYKAWLMPRKGKDAV